MHLQNIKCFTNACMLALHCYSTGVLSIFCQGVREKYLTSKGVHSPKSLGTTARSARPIMWSTVCSGDHSAGPTDHRVYLLFYEKSSRAKINICATGVQNPLLVVFSFFILSFYTASASRYLLQNQHILFLTEVMLV